MALIEVRRLSTVFGPDPRAALQRAHAGATKAALLVDSGHTLALHGVDLDIQAGEVFVVMGLSGSGKSTLLRHLNRLVEPTEGELRLDGQDLRALDDAALNALRQSRLAMVFQRFALLPHRSVLDNVAFALELRGVVPAERRARARMWIERVGLQGYEQQRPAQLSGGMQQRVGLARALCGDADVLLMDEPFSALDPLVRSQLQAELLRLQREARRTIVFVTHDLDEALRLGDRIAILRDGRVRQVGTPQDLLLRPADAHVAAFVRDVNRARALRVGPLVEPWPVEAASAPVADAADADATLEQVLPRLLGRTQPLPVQRDGRLVGMLTADAARRVLVGGAERPQDGVSNNAV